MNGKSAMISHAPPFVLRLSKDEGKVFQQNQDKDLTLQMTLQKIMTSTRPSLKPITPAAVRVLLFP